MGVNKRSQKQVKHKKVNSVHWIEAIFKLTSSVVVLAHQAMAKKSPDSHRMEGVDFVRISKDFVQHRSELYRLLVSQKGKLYYTSKDVTKAGEYTLKNADDSPWTYPIKDAQYISDSKVLAVYDKLGSGNNQSPQLECQVLQSDPQDSKVLKAQAGDQAFQLSELNGPETRLATVRIKLSKTDRIIFIINKKVKMLISKPSTTEGGSISEIPHLISAEESEISHGVAAYEPTTNSYFAVFLKLNTKTKLHSFLFQQIKLKPDDNSLEKLTQVVKAAKPLPKTPLDPATRFVFTKSGISYDPSIPETLKLSLRYLYGFGTTIGAGTLATVTTPLDFQSTDQRSSKGFGNIIAGDSVIDSQFHIYLTHGAPIYSVSQGDLTLGTKTTNIHIFMDRSFGFLILVAFIQQDTIWNSELAEGVLSVSEDNHLIFATLASGSAQPKLSAPNLVNTGSYSNLYCPASEYKNQNPNAKTDGYQFICIPLAQSFGNQYCEHIGSTLDYSCAKCMERADGTEIVKVRSPSMWNLMRYSCRPKHFFCSPPETAIHTKGNVCYPCSGLPGCEVCQDLFPACTKCMPGYGPDILSNLCVKCNSIDPNCKSCETLSTVIQTCKECEAPYIVDPKNFKKCKLLSCPEDSFVEAKTCKKCSSKTEKCKTCDKKTGECLTCEEGFLVNKKTKMCQKKCGEFDYISDDNQEGSCKACDSLDFLKQCSKCSMVNGVVLCSQCKPGFELFIKEDGKGLTCKEPCGKGNYKSKDGKGCEKCTDGPGGVHCAECQDTDGKCTKCKEGSYINPNGRCITGCGFAFGYIKKVEQESGGSYYTCFKCKEQEGYENCSKCEHLTGRCLNCDKSYTLSQETGLCERVCNSDKYWSQNKCYDCSAKTKNCLKCSYQGGECLECPLNYHLNSEKICEIHCLRDHYKIDSEGGGECHPCYLVKKSGRSCIRCRDNTGECEACQVGYFLNEDRFCQKECPERDFWMGESYNDCFICSQRMEGCAKCMNTTGTCLRCQEGYWLNQTSECQRSCERDGEFWKAETNTCHNCTKNCLSCFNNTGERDDCNRGFWLNSTKDCQKSCSETTPQYWKAEENECFECSENCLKCQNKTGNCLRCSSGYQAKNGSRNCFLAAKTTSGETPEIVTQYFDKTTFTVVIVYDRVITGLNLPKNQIEAYLMILETDRKKINIIKEDIDESGFKLILKLDFEQDEVNNGRIGLKSKESRRRLQENPEGGRQEEQQQGEEEENEWLAVIEKVSYYKSTTNMEKIENVGYWLRMISLTLSILILIPTVTGFMVLVTSTQMIYSLRLVDANLPSNTLSFTSQFKNSLIQPTTLSAIPVDMKRCKMSPVFYSAEHNCLALNESVLWLFIWTGVILIVRSLLKFIPVNFDLSSMSPRRKRAEEKFQISKRQESPIQARSNRNNLRREALKKWFDMRFIPTLLIAAQLDTMRACLISLKYGEFEGVSMILNNSLSAIIVLMYLGFNIKTIQLALKIHNKQKLKQKEKEENNKKTKKSKKEARRPERRPETFYALSSTISTILAFVIVLSTSLPILQLLTIIGVILVCLAYLIAFVPFNSILIHTSLLVRNIVLVLAFAAALISSPELMNLFSEKQRYNTFGLGINIILAGSLITIILINIIIALSEVRKYLKRTKKAVESPRKEMESIEVQFPQEDLEEKSESKGPARTLSRVPFRSSLNHPVGNKLEIMESRNTFNEADFEFKFGKEKEKERGEEQGKRVMGKLGKL